MEGLGFILLGILAMIAPTIAIMMLCGFFKIGGVIGSWLDLKTLELKNKREKLGRDRR